MSIRRSFRWLLVAVTVLGPALGVYAMLRFYVGAALRDFTPTWWDEIENFQSTSTFVAAGFRGGYFTAIEDPAPASFSHFSTHGPTFPILQGLWGKLFGWHYYSPVLFNAAVLTAAIAIFLWLVRPNLWQLGLSAATFITFWPFYAYVPSNMQEPLHFAIALVLGASFYVALLEPKRFTRRAKVALFVGILVAALIRSSWAIFFVPYFLLGIEKRPLPIVLAFAKAGSSIVVSLWLWRYLSAPYRNIPQAYLMIKVVTAETGFQTLYANFLQNLAAIGRPTKSFNDVELPTVFQTIALVPVAAGLLLWGVRRRKSIVLESFHLYNLVSIIGSTFVLYFVVAGAPRVFPLHLLVTLVLLIASNRRAHMLVVGVVAASNLLVFAPAARELRNLHAAHFAAKSRAVSNAFRAELADVAVYRPDRDGWCNTVLTGLQYYDTQFAGLVPGLGLSAFREPSEMSTVRSRYIIADPSTLGQLHVRTELVKPLTLPPGTNLYLNAERRCD